MTVIAYRAGLMAADSGTFAASAITGRCRKIHTTKSGHLIGMAGTLALAAPFIDWIEDGAKPGERESFNGDHDFIAIVVDRHGLVSIYEDDLDFPVLVEAEYYAVGSGYTFAIGAMAAGATAEEAVEITIQHHTNAVAPVQVESLPRKKSKAKLRVVA